MFKDESANQISMVSITLHTPTANKPEYSRKRILGSRGTVVAEGKSSRKCLTLNTNESMPRTERILREPQANSSHLDKSAYEDSEGKNLLKRYMNYLELKKKFKIPKNVVDTLRPGNEGDVSFLVKIDQGEVAKNSSMMDKSLLSLNSLDSPRGFSFGDLRQDTSNEISENDMNLKRSSLQKSNFLEPPSKINSQIKL
jgi:hypothetical protein